MVKVIRRFVISDDHKMLLLGCGGSGKTFSIINAFNSTNYKIAFCAFTNKATQVLRLAAAKYNIKFSAEFSTIHRLLQLEPRYYETESELAFKFDINKVINLEQYDILIFDECSTISKELYSYLLQAWDFVYFKHERKLKYIFLGDFWQLPPVGEDTSIVFKDSTEDKWPICKLTKVMRSGNEHIAEINQRLLYTIDLFRNKDEQFINKFHIKYPYCILPKKKYNCYIHDVDELHNSYLNTWHSGINDIVILTYSRANCEKTNFCIQDKIDMLAGRELPEQRVLSKFHVGDRCSLDRPIEISIISKHVIPGTPDYYYTADEKTGESLYNGEIFDVIEAENVLIKTSLNRLSIKEIPSYFNGQVLTVRRIGDSTYTNYKILHIEESIINNTRKLIRRHTSRDFYLNLMSQYIKWYPKLDYGYCLTIYKSQGSEWNTVLVNLNSIKWSIVGGSYDADLKKKKALLKATYTAISRAQQCIKLFWY